jgi:ABC-type molybdate transport system substrate-binding protein
MNRRLGWWLALAALPVTASAQAPVHVYAAGSLRAPLTAIAADFEKAHAHPVKLTFGPSGVLRDRIARGEPADVFASANMEHPQSLTQKGWSRATAPFARNEICVLASRRVPVTTDNVLAVLLDAQWKLATSTPKADPSGDYAWEVFRRAEAIRPGAFAALEGKARTLTGGPQSPPPPPDRSVYAMLVSNGEADVFLTYCTNAQQAIEEVPSLALVRLPDNLRVGATYGLAVRKGADASAQAFADYILSAAGQGTLARFGFAPP